MIPTPVCIVNFKSYPNATGRNALTLAKICDKVSQATNTQIIICVQTADIPLIAKSVKIPVFAQNVDPYEAGAHTGWVLAENLKEHGAQGTLLNHSEHKLSIDVLKKCLLRAKAAHLLTIVCAETSEEARLVASLKPDAIAIEPPELIGSDISVSSAKPELIEQSVRAVSFVPILCGAGIHTKDDVSKAIKLGAKGILVSSGVVNSPNPEKALKELVSGLR
ncbi:MAG: triose-phosphate isomerase, partial [Nanoarchaeota archaeon]